ncbi:hypothetical protein DVH05_005602 [Phytophthora capsici]|nr:hypothetical protein DVH05_005602 [Phytophthora capsici]
MEHGLKLQLRTSRLQACRDAVTVIQLSGGKTSKATLHLSNVHNVTSEKTAIETARKRSRDDDIARILASALCRDNTKRLALLLETQRIVNNNLPFSFGEYYESRVIKEISTKAEFQATLNSQAITHAIVELYASANREAIGFMRDNRVGPMACFTMVADFWSSKHQGDKYLGLRVYFIDAQFRFTSILLGVRHFRPLYGEREQGIRTPFHRWLLGILADFQLCPADFFGSTSDGGPDVKWMMSEGLKLKWEWCIPHLVNAATKTACGMTQKSKNPDMSELINRISQTIFQAHRNEKMGDLMEQLMLLLGKGKGTKLIAYRPHRFMGLAACIRRILEKWDALRSWFEERIAKALRDGARDIPVDFPLVNDKETLIQILSLLQPIELVSKRSQSEAPNQVDVLLTLYALQMSTLALNTPIVRFNSSQKAPAVIQPTELTPCTKTTRVLLQRAFYKNFFYRYIDKKYLSHGSFIFEMQYLLHPAVKHAEGPMDAIVTAVAVQENMTESEISQHIVKIRRGVIRRIKDVMKSVADEGPNDSVAGEVGAATSCQSAVADVFSADIMRLFAIQQSPPPAPTTQSILQSRIDSEIDQWFEHRSVMETREGVPESILQFWRRQLESNNYRYLPLVAKVIFAVPSSSAQIERDFGNSGQMVSSLRASTSARNIDMASFLRQNRRFVGVCQCPKIDPKDIENYIPTNVKYNLDPETNNRIEWRAMSEQCFSASLSDSE